MPRLSPFADNSRRVNPARKRKWETYIAKYP